MAKQPSVTSRYKFVTDPELQKRLDRDTLLAIGKWGAYVRRTARQSMRYRKKPAPPGKPPSAHPNPNGNIRELLHFYYDLHTDTVVVGPRIRSNPKGSPHRMEFGGRVHKGPNPHRTYKIGDVGPVRVVRGSDGKDKLVYSRLKSAAQVANAEKIWKKHCLWNTRDFYVESRPYMLPAMQKNLHVAPKLFKSCIRGN